MERKMYGIRKQFSTSSGIVLADTKAEAKTIAEGRTEVRPVIVKGPNDQPSLRSLGIRAIVRQMNRAGL